MRGGSPVMQMRLRTPAVCAPAAPIGCQNVAVAAAEVADGLDAGVLLNQLAGHLGAHARAGAGAVGNVDGVDALFGAQLGAGDFAGGVHAARRQDLHECDEFPLGQFGAQLGLLRHGNGRKGVRLDLRLLHRDAELRLQRLQRARSERIIRM